MLHPWAVVAKDNMLNCLTSLLQGSRFQDSRVLELQVSELQSFQGFQLVEIRKKQIHQLPAVCRGLPPPSHPDVLDYDATGDEKTRCRRRASERDWAESLDRLERDRGSPGGNPKAGVGEYASKPTAGKRRYRKT